MLWDLKLVPPSFIHPAFLYSHRIPSEGIRASGSESIGFWRTLLYKQVALDSLLENNQLRPLPLSGPALQIFQSRGTTFLSS